MAVYSNSTSNTIITGTADADSIYNVGKNVKIEGGNGADFIINTFKEVSKILGTSGNDNLYLVADSDVLVYTGAGNDTVTVCGGGYSTGNALIDCGPGRDVIYLPYEGYQPLRITLRNFNFKEDTLYFPDWAFYYNNYYFRTYVENGNLTLIDRSIGFYTITFEGVVSTEMIKDVGVRTWNSGYTYLGYILWNKSDGYDVAIEGEDSYVTIFGGAGDDYIENDGNDVIIYGENGSDSINNLGSNVTIDGGYGDDYIENFGYKNITICTGVGDDTIVESGSVLNLAISSYTSSYSGEDIFLLTESGSVVVKGGKNKTINIISVADTSTGGSDTQIGGSETTSSLDNQTILGTEGADRLFNEGGNNVYIYGLESDDEIGNLTPAPFSGKTVGKNVSLNGGKGNDKIHSTSIKDNIIYASGDGNDTVFTYYNSADIAGNSLQIHLTSGTFKGATLDKTFSKSRLILDVGGGNIIIDSSYGVAAKNIPITITDSNGKQFNFTGEYSIPRFELTLGKNANHTAEYRNNYYGEIITANNGTIFIEDGDKVTTDSNGNINSITISDTSHKIKTPLNRSIYKDVTIKDSAGKVIAVMKYGEAYIYWRDGNCVIEAVNKDLPISLEAQIDNVKIIGSNAADNIVSSGKNVSIDSKIGNDFISNSGTGATIVGGKDNDTINGTVDTVKLISGRIKNASLKGADLVISAGSSFIKEDNSHTVTIKNAKDKNITVVNSEGETFNIKNTYAGDPKILRADIEELKTLFEDTENHLYAKAATYLAPDTSEADDAKQKSVAEFKKDLYVRSGDLKSIPEDVFEEIATNIFTALENSKMQEYSPTDTRQWLSNVFTIISQLGEDKKTIKSGDDTYTVIFKNLIGAGSGTSDITIIKNNSKKPFAELNWIDNPKHANSVISDYLKILSKLHENVWWNVITGLAKDIGGDTAVKYTEYAKSIIFALATGTSDDVIDTIKEIAMSEFMEYISGDGQLELEQLIKDNVPNGRGKYIVKAAKAFKNLTEQFGEMKSKFEDYASLIEAANSNDPAAVYESFLSAYDEFVENEMDVINNINSDSSFLDDIGDFVSNSIFALFGNSDTSTSISSSARVMETAENVHSNKNAISSNANNAVSMELAVGKSVYFDEVGDLISSDTAALLSIKFESDTFVYSALTSNDQNISLGTANDKFNFELNTYEGNDTIYTNSSAKVTINSGDGDDVITNTGDEVLINCGDGNDSTWGGGDKVTINGGEGNDRLEIWGTNSSVNTGEGDNLVFVHGKNVTITGGAGDDSIENWDDYSGYPLKSSGNAQIFAGEGNDFVKHFGSFATISAGKGNDTIQTISGLTYNNTSSNIYIYANGDGNDIIYGFNSTDTLQISGAKYSTVKNGSDLKVSVGNGSILLKDAANIAVKIVGTIESGNIANETLPTGISIKSSILTASSSFKGNKIDLANYDATKVNASALTSGINIVGTAAANSLKGGKGADTITGGAGKNTLTGGAGKDIFVYSDGNDLITDYKAGEDKIKIGTITNSTVKGSDVILTTASGNLTLKGVKDKVITFVDNSGKSTEKIFFAGTSYAPLATGLSYDAKRTILTASSKFSGNALDLGKYLSTVTKVNASTLTKGINIVGNSSASNSIKGGKSADTISGNSGKDTISGGNGNDSIFGGADNDKLFGDAGNDTLNGGTGNDTFTGGAGQDVFIYTGGNDLITDYKAGEDKIKIGTITNSTVKGSDVVLTTNNDTLTVKGAKDKVVTFVDDNGSTTNKIFFANTSYEPLVTGLTYDAKRIVLTASNKFTESKIDLGEYLPTVTKVNASAVNQGLNIIGNTSANSIKGGKGADTINGGDGKDTIIGGTGNDSIYGGNDNDKLQGDAGNDTLNGGRGNDTLTGGAGNDVFVYEGGRDIITDYAAGQDSIKISGTISKVSYSGKNVIFTIGSGSLTVNNAKGKEIAVTDFSNKTQTYSRTLEILYDNNFMTDEIGIDAISEVTDKNYSVGQIESNENNDKLKISDSIVSASTFDEK